MKDDQITMKPPKIIMVETSHPGNIGAAARAMKTMCLSDIVLVQPKVFPDPIAFARASGAADILENARRCETLPEAIADCQKVVGITARNRRLSAPVVTPGQLMQQMKQDGENIQVAWVFGRERNGLSNEEIDLCTSVCTIPSNPDYGSLNIAAAIQILCYEWYVSGLVPPPDKNDVKQTSQNELASISEREGFYEHLWQALARIDFLDQENPIPLMRKLRRLFDRAKLSRAEINILRGILKNIINQ